MLVQEWGVPVRPAPQLPMGASGYEALLSVTSCMVSSGQEVLPASSRKSSLLHLHIILFLPSIYLSFKPLLTGALFGMDIIPHYQHSPRFLLLLEGEACTPKR